MIQSPLRAITFLQPKPPFDFNLTRHHNDHFRGIHATDSSSQECLVLVLDIDKQLIMVHVKSVGTVDCPMLELTVEGEQSVSDTIESVKLKVSWILGTQQNLSPFYAMAQHDKTLSLITNDLWGLHVPHSASVYESLVTAILGQRITSKVAAMLRKSVIETYGYKLKSKGSTYYGFPPPQVLARARIDDLRKLKLGSLQAKYIVNISTDVTTGKLMLENLNHYTATEVVRKLIKIKGIGLWTAQWLLIRGLGIEDGFPSSDSALRGIMEFLTKETDRISIDQAEINSSRWSPFRSYAATYLFTALRFGLLGNIPLSQKPLRR